MNGALPWPFVIGSLLIAWIALQPSWWTSEKRPAWIRRGAKAQRVLVVLFISVIVLIQFYSLLGSG